MQERFSAACRTVKIGDTLTTKQLVEMGYTDDKARKRLIDSGVLKRDKTWFLFGTFRVIPAGNPARPEGVKEKDIIPTVRRVSASALESTLSKKSMKEEHNNVQRITSNFVGFRAPR